MRFLRWFGVVVVVVVVLVVGGVALLEWKAEVRFQQKYTVNVKDIPIPFPLTSDEIAQLNPPANADLAALAMQRAIDRGKHYTESRAACSDCHGRDFGGGIIFDNPAMGRWVAPNITRGGRTKKYTSVDWVRIIRHGIKPDGTAATMPSEDFTGFSDQEISDVAAYISSMPPVSRVMPPTKIGPMFAFLVLNGERRVSAEHIDHDAARPVYPPAIMQSVELGGHLVEVCKGCHGAHLGGGKIAAGDPSWPPAANLTFDDSGLGRWSLEDFMTALREGTRPDGTTLNEAMPVGYTKNFSDDEIASMYMYLKTIPRLPMGSH